MSTDYPGSLEHLASSSNLLAVLAEKRRAEMKAIRDRLAAEDKAEADAKEELRRREMGTSPIDRTREKDAYTGK